ncbi:hypothetical protein AcW2_005722 [Taiwanofungus camphoratus]|nr:hypothetical protein AcW2_005722 [Antrodia cinnamomea]
MSKGRDKRKNVVIVGGGHAGTLLARTLSATLDSARYNLLLISDRPYAIHLLAAARMTITGDGNFEQLALMPYQKMFVNGNGRAIIDRVTAIEERARGKGGVLVLQSGKRIEYAALALACGFLWSGPLDFPYVDEDIRAHIKQWRKMYADASHVVLVGGGAVGIETAGELRDAYPDKKITIIQADKMLLNPTYPHRYRQDIERRVRARGIDIIFDDLVDYIPELGTVGIVTRSGRTVPTADLVVPTFGPRPNTAWIASLGPDVLDERHLVKIEPTFEVTGHPGVFALGDITDWNEQKQAAKAPAHVAVVAPNMLSFLARCRSTKTYKGNAEVIFIPVGKNGGSAYFDMLWGVILGAWFVRWVKGKDLFINKTRQERGL